MIYFIESAGRIKIGFSEKPTLRLSKIMSDSPFPALLIGVMDGGLAEERELHAQFAQDRFHGEWFMKTSSLSMFINQNSRPPDEDRDEPKTALGKFIRAAGMTDAEFGALVGVSQSQVSRIKNDASKPSLEVAVAIEKVTNGEVPAKSFVEKSGEAA
jgi:DNA-binding XRE family transcriptional regulator